VSGGQECDDWEENVISRLLEELRNSDIRLWADEGRIHYDAAPGALTPDLAARLREHRAELLRHLERRRAHASDTVGREHVDEPGPRGERRTPAPAEPEASTASAPSADAGIWLRPLIPAAPAPPADAVLYVLPPAGAGPSMFQHWSDGVPPGLDVVLVHAPGREDRLDEAPYTRVGPLADRIAEAIAGHDDRPVVLFGHSAGALVAREVAKRMTQLPPASARPRLRLLVVAGSPTPDTVTGREHLMDDDQLVQALTAWGGTPGEITGDSDVYSVFLPCLRGDLSVVADSRTELTDRERLGVPVLALAGTGDPVVSYEESRAWRHWTTAGFHIHRIPGTHFFPATAATDIFACILRALARHPGKVRLSY
jgi:surfactin synthase thioesterase subunit